ncbi:MAG: hypothetical protein EOO89_02475, partial [Pedobacter sp.]
MKHKVIELSFMLIFSLLTFSGENVFGQHSSLLPIQLRCEYLVDPKGLDELYPRLSWTQETLNQSSFGAAQTAYQIIVSNSLKNL